MKQHVDRENMEGESDRAAIPSQPPAQRPNQPLLQQQQQQQQQQQHQSSRAGASEEDDDSYRTAYAGFTYEPIPSSGRPGTPHRHFAESYLVRRAPSGGGEETGSTIQDATSSSALLAGHVYPVLHKSANGLVVVVTAGACAGSASGSAAAPDDVDLSSGSRAALLAGVDVVVSEAPVDSQGGKRKKQAKMLRGRSVQHVVRPDDTLAVLHFDNCVDGDEMRSEEEGSGEDAPPWGQSDAPQRRELLCGVWGTVLEINPNLTAELVRSDPTLNGYVAIVLPTGPFPPPQQVRGRGDE